MLQRLMEKLSAFGLPPRRLLYLVGGILVFILVMDFNSRLTELVNLSSQRDQLETEVAQLTSTINAQVTEIAYANSTEAVEDFIRKQHKGEPGDIPIVFLTPPEATPLPPVYAEPTPITVQNWQVWWALFFGE